MPTEEYVMSQSTENAQVTTQVMAAAGVSFALFSSVANMSSPQTFWMTLKQFQLILLTLLTSAYIPSKIVKFLSGMKSSTCSFSFIPFDKMPGIDKIIDWLDIDLRYGKLDHFGIESGSAFVNVFSII